MSLVSERFRCIGILGSETKYHNTCNSFSLVKYFPSVFSRGRRLKAEPHNFWCLLLCFFFIFFKFHFSCVSASPINFLIVVSELLVIFFGVGYYSLKGYYSRIRYYSCIRYCSCIWYYSCMRYYSRETVGTIQEFCSAKQVIVV